MAMQPSAPIYIVSKGRWQPERRMTGRALERMGLCYRIVVEEQEADDYRASCDPRYATVLVLDPRYRREYDTCDDLGDSKPKGSGAARNFAWDHALAEGHAWQWTMDDNIAGFVRLYRNQKIRCDDGAVLRAMEEFAARYINVAMAGPHYRYFAAQRAIIPPFTLNSRVYSCNLIRTAVPFRWRGRYNEDTILSLDMLKAGWCTLLFKAFLANKLTTQAKLPGGNTDSVYLDGTLPKSQQLVDVHPDVSRVVWKYGRWHHHVDYSRFKRNRLQRRPDVVIPEGPNEYGMKLVRVGKAVSA